MAANNMLNVMVEAMGVPFTVAYGGLWLGFVYLLAVALPRAKKTLSWPTVTGVVEASDLSESKSLTKNGGSIVLYQAKVRYSYSVDGKAYTSTKLGKLDYQSSSKNTHLAVVKKYTPGSTVRVFYDAKNPSMAVLKPGFSGGHAVASLFFLLSIGAMTAVLYVKL